MRFRGAFIVYHITNTMGSPSATNTERMVPNATHHSEKAFHWATERYNILNRYVQHRLLSSAVYKTTGCAEYIRVGPVSATAGLSGAKIIKGYHEKC